MKIAEFPRPPQDNGRGVHWSARIYHPSGRDLDFWIAELTAMHIKWVKLLDDGDGSSLELCRRLLDAGIMPVVRLFRERPNPGRIGGREVSGLRKLIAAGVRYFESNNEPDLPAEWKDNHKPANWLDIVVDNFIYDADIILNEGGLPAVPAMGPGGRDNIIKRIKDRGRTDLFERGAWLAIHNYTLNHPLDYPDDPVNQEGKPLTQEEYERFPAWAWDHRSRQQINERRARDKNPGQTLAEDANCFRGWEWAGRMVHDTLGFYIPIISTEGGPVVGWGDDLRYPKVTPDQQAEWQVAIARFLQEQAPPWYFTCCTWLLASRPLGDWNPTWEQMSWYTDAWNEQFGLAGRLPVVQALKDLPPRTRPELHKGTASLALSVTRADTDQPVANVPVAVEAVDGGDGARRVRATSDERGKLLLEQLPAGRYQVLVFDSVQATVELQQNQRREVTVSVRAGRRSRIEGTVTDTDGTPQPDLPVTLHQASPPRLLAETRTDARGRYAFENLPAGKVLVRVAPGSDRATERRNIALDGWETTTVDFAVPPAASLRYEVVEKRLLPPGETSNDNLLFGRVLDEKGDPVDGVTVRMRWTGAGPDTTFPTVKSGQNPFKPRGYFEFIHTAGVFMLDVVDPEYESAVADNLVTADMPERSRPISYEVTFQRKAAARSTDQSSIVGRVRGGSPNLSVTLSGGGLEPRLARLGAEGGFRFAELPAGVYDVSLAGIGVIADDVTLDGINSVNLDFAMLGQISGLVLPTDQPATVVLTCEQYSIRKEDETDEEGRYLFTDLPADTYTLKLKGSDLPAQEVICDGVGSVDGPVFDREEGEQSVIHGRITDHRGTPVANAILWLRTMGRRVAESQTGADGSYRFTDLGAGTYGIELVGPGLVAQNLRVDGRNEVREDVQLAPPAQGVIVGRLVDQTDRPVANRALQLNGPVTRRATSAADGRFRFDALPPGDYTVRVADAPGVQTSVSLSGDEQESVSLQLPAAPASGERPLAHYLYLAGDDTDRVASQLSLAADFILRKVPTVGFDAAACTKASQVTIIGQPAASLLRALEQAQISFHQIPGDLEQLQAELEAIP